MAPDVPREPPEGTTCGQICPQGSDLPALRSVPAGPGMGRSSPTLYRQTPDQPPRAAAMLCKDAVMELRVSAFEPPRSSQLPYGAKII